MIKRSAQESFDLIDMVYQTYLFPKHDLKLHLTNMLRLHDVNML
jgi:hypothetical protein